MKALLLKLLGPAGWVIDNWKLIAFALLVAALSIQSYRLLSAQRERDLLAQEKQAREQRDAMRLAQNLKNKERTDEEYSSARMHAATASVRAQSTARVRAPRPVAVAPGGNGAAACFDRGKLDEELAGFAQRFNERLNRLVAELSGRNAARLTAVARAGEELAAAYRSCRVYTLNLATDSPAPRAIEPESAACELPREIASLHSRTAAR